MKLTKIPTLQGLCRGSSGEDCASNVGGVGSIPGERTELLSAMPRSQEKKNFKQSLPSRNLYYISNSFFF